MLMFRPALIARFARTGVFLALVILPAARADAGAPRAAGQSSTATLSGTTIDESRALVPQVDLTVTNLDTGIQRRAVTNDQGHFAIPSLPPGRYSVTAHRQGFATTEVREVLLHVGDHHALSLQLKVGQLSDVVHVEGVATAHASSASVSTVIDREFLENLPLNGRSLHALLEHTPGTVLVKGVGQFSINGQRDNANYFTVDGVSGNAGVRGVPNLGATAGGTVPAFNALGTTAGLVSVEATQEFRVLTSTYAAEFGRTPGGQISIVTRSGSNAFRGALFEYFRNDALDATDWFANSRGFEKPPLRQNDFGGTIGGPVVRNRTFFFFTYEALRLRLPQVGIGVVPTLAARESARPEIQPFLKAFPLPNGRDRGNELAEFAASYADAWTSDAASVRVDHTFGSNLTVFGRYSDAPSEAAERGVQGTTLSDVFASRIDTRTLTVGATQSLGRSMLHEVRINVSRTNGASRLELDDFGGAVSPSDAVLFPAFVTRNDALMGFGMTGGAGFQVGTNVDNYQRQFNLVESLSLVRGRHEVKVGVDYRRLAPVLDVLTYGQFANFANGALGALTAQASSVQIQSNPVRRQPLFTNVSAYAQDAWRISGRATLTLGLRWEWNPPPTERDGNQAYTVVGLENPATMTLAPRGTPLWKTGPGSFAPRLGVAYQLSQTSGRESVLRGGAGIFYDLGTGSIGQAFGQGRFPIGRSRISRTCPFQSIRYRPNPLQSASRLPIGCWSSPTPTSSCRGFTSGASAWTRRSRAIRSCRRLTWVPPAGVCSAVNCSSASIPTSGTSR